MGPNPRGARYRWPAGKCCGVVFTADVDAESPFLWRHRGQSVDALGELEMRRFGPRVGLGRILDLLDAFGLKGSFYVPGVVASTYPDVLPAIVGAGHEAGLHGDYHERADRVGADENRAILQRCLARFQAQVGQTPCGYRSPAWEMPPDLHHALREHGLTYDSSLMGYDHPYGIDGLTEVPVQWLTDDAVYFRYVGGGRDGWPPVTPRAVLESWIEEFEGIREHGGLLTITIHPWISGRAQRIRLLRDLFRHITRYQDVWIATAAEVAAYHAGSENAAVFDVPLQLADTQF